MNMIKLNKNIFLDFQCVASWNGQNASSKPRVAGEIQGLRLLSQLQDLPRTAGASELLISPRAYLGPGDGLENVGKLARHKSIALKKKDGSITNKVWIYTVHMSICIVIYCIYNHHLRRFDERRNGNVLGIRSKFVKVCRQTSKWNEETWSSQHLLAKTRLGPTKIN